MKKLIFEDYVKSLKHSYLEMLETVGDSLVYAGKGMLCLIIFPLLFLIVPFSRLIMYMTKAKCRTKNCKKEVHAIIKTNHNRRWYFCRDCFEDQLKKEGWQQDDK